MNLSIFQTCPSDGTVLSFGIVIDDRLDQVKNMTYSLHHFLGPQTWHDLDSNNQTSGVSEHKVQPLIQNKDAIVAKEDDYIKKLKYNPDNELYQCVIYLSPGDYHRFHSPADWSIDFRRYFPGIAIDIDGTCISVMVFISIIIILMSIFYFSFKINQGYVSK